MSTAAITTGWLLLWTVLVCYDLRAPSVLLSVARYVRFPVDASVLGEMPTSLPTEPNALAAYVDRRLEFAQDSSVYGVPWYFPTPREALRAGRGDCEARSVVLASLLAARGIPYRFQASFSHMWVDFPGRRVEPGEESAAAMMERVDGRYRFRWPSLPRLREHLANQRELLWDPLSPPRKVLLLAGWPVILVGVPRRRRREPRQRGRAQKRGTGERG